MVRVTFLLETGELPAFLTKTFISTGEEFFVFVVKGQANISEVSDDGKSSSLALVKVAILPLKVVKVINKPKARKKTIMSVMKFLSGLFMILIIAIKGYIVK